MIFQGYDKIKEAVSKGQPFFIFSYPQMRIKSEVDVISVTSDFVVFMLWQKDQNKI
jgi:hypothetical protein